MGEVIEWRGIRIRVFGHLSSIKGLMFDDMKGYEAALIRGNSVWMPFVRYRLKLYFLKGRKVVCIKDAVPMTLDPSTWRVYRCRLADSCLESRVDLGLAPGDVLDI